MNRNFILLLFLRWENLSDIRCYKLSIIRKKEKKFSFPFLRIIPFSISTIRDPNRLLLGFSRKFHSLGECFNPFSPPLVYLYPDVSYSSLENASSRTSYFLDSSSLPIFHYLPSPSIPRSPSPSYAFIFDVKTARLIAERVEKKKRKKKRKNGSAIS